MNDDVTSWDDQLTHILWRAQNAAHRRVQEALDELNVTTTQLGIAVHLGQLGALSAADLSRMFHIAPQSVGTALNRLEKSGWVRRRSHPIHGRVVLYELTGSGQAGAARGRELMAAANADVTSGLADSEIVVLSELLRRVTIGIDGPDLPVVSTWPVDR